MATIMPHGVLFRSGKEKLIREIFIEDDIIEAIISLPPDREYAEGKAQNKLRPEDIEKIDFVFTHKREIPKYSRLVDKTEIVEKHDYNLNIRRYVDNTPEPEPEDVQAHLIGGVPEGEVLARQSDLAKFDICETLLFTPDRPGYFAFVKAIQVKSAIRGTLEAAPGLNRTLDTHRGTLNAWWAVGRDASPNYARRATASARCPKYARNCSPASGPVHPLGRAGRIQERRGLRQLVATDPL
jgi:type I restriction enzyme M protein